MPILPHNRANTPLSHVKCVFGDEKENREKGSINVSQLSDMSHHLNISLSLGPLAVFSKVGASCSVYIHARLRNISLAVLFACPSQGYHPQKSFKHQDNSEALLDSTSRLHSSPCLPDYNTIAIGACGLTCFVSLTFAQVKIINHPQLSQHLIMRFSFATIAFAGLALSLGARASPIPEAPMDPKQLGFRCIGANTFILDGIHEQKCSACLVCDSVVVGCNWPPGVTSCPTDGGTFNPGTTDGTAPETADSR